MATKKKESKIIYSEPSSYFTKEQWDRINGKDTTKKKSGTIKKSGTTKKKK